MARLDTTWDLHPKTWSRKTYVTTTGNAREKKHGLQKQTTIAQVVCICVDVSCFLVRWDSSHLITTCSQIQKWPDCNWHPYIFPKLWHMGHRHDYMSLYLRPWQGLYVFRSCGMTMMTIKTCIRTWMPMAWRCIKVAPHLNGLATSIAKQVG